MLPGRFLGIAWYHGDVLSYFIRVEPTEKHKRPQIIARSAMKNAAEHARTIHSNLQNSIKYKEDSGLAPAPDPSSTNVDCEEDDISKSSSSRETSDVKNLNRDDASIRTATMAASTVDENDLDDLILQNVITDDLQEELSESLTDDEGGDGNDRIAPSGVLQSMIDDVGLEGFDFK